MKTNTALLAIKPFKNRNGVTSYRVNGWFHGERVRKNFKTRQEAAAEKSALEIKSIQAASGLRPTATILTPEQQSEAEALFLKIKGQKHTHTLTFYVDYALTNYKEPEFQKPLADAVTEYRKLRDEDHAKGLISTSQWLTIKKHMTKLVDSFPRVLVSDLSADKLKKYFSRGNASLKTYNNRRGLLSTFLKYAQQQDWIAVNPIGKVPHYRISHKRGSAATLTVKKAAELMEYIEGFHGGKLAPFFALCLFAGIRPDSERGEIAKLKPEHVNMETGVIHIEPEVSKIDMKRNVTIQPNLVAWLRAYPLEKNPILVPNIKHLRTGIIKKFGLSHDVLRHTFISMHVAKFRSMGDAALQAGNSEAIIRKHYLDVKSPAEAEAFFNIMPLRAASQPEKQTAEKTAQPASGSAAATDKPQGSALPYAA
ncbi:integrase [Ereboglobus sp. PH5-10]|uniref:tyrosine-type recombinase/integrase n=1 Tax=Ereboglobus sp. PH5-10 TaxID=2940629 RepID=UPI002406FDFD|nr:site-specific integrase [Ereboglobus sp. PH5-10]MDF9828511.1 integrase [Ereboglobus sp. PH5-10]